MTVGFNAIRKQPSVEDEYCHVRGLKENINRVDCRPSIKKPFDFKRLPFDVPRIKERKEEACQHRTIDGLEYRQRVADTQMVIDASKYKSLKESVDYYLHHVSCSSYMKLVELSAFKVRVYQLFLAKEAKQKKGDVFSPMNSTFFQISRGDYTKNRQLLKQLFDFLEKTIVEKKIFPTDKLQEDELYRYFYYGVFKCIQDIKVKFDGNDIGCIKLIINLLSLHLCHIFMENNEEILEEYRSLKQFIVNKDSNKGVLFQMLFVYLIFPTVFWRKYQSLNYGFKRINLGEIALIAIRHDLSVIIDILCLDDNKTIVYQHALRYLCMIGGVDEKDERDLLLCFQQAKIDLNYNNSSFSSLFLACQNNHVTLVESLIALDCKFHSDVEKQLVLKDVAANGYVDITPKILDME